MYTIVQKCKRKILNESFTFVFQWTKREPFSSRDVLGCGFKEAATD
jgi:hypothetical protein